MQTGSNPRSRVAKPQRTTPQAGNRRARCKGRHKFVEATGFGPSRLRPAGGGLRRRKPALAPGGNGNGQNRQRGVQAGAP